MHETTVEEMTPEQCRAAAIGSIQEAVRLLVIGDVEHACMELGYATLWLKVA